MSGIFEIISFILALLVIVPREIQAQYEDNKCQSAIHPITPRHSLNISRYMGDWYLHERGLGNVDYYPEPWWKCSKHQLSFPNENDQLTIQFHDVYQNKSDDSTLIQDKWISVNSSISPLNSMWTMTSEDLESGDIIVDDMIILAVDLEFADWTVVYICTLTGPTDYHGFERIWGLTRSRIISFELKNVLDAIMVGFGLQIGDIKSIDHTDCVDESTENNI